MCDYWGFLLQFIYAVPLKSCRWNQLQMAHWNLIGLKSYYFLNQVLFCLFLSDWSAAVTVTTSQYMTALPLVIHSWESSASMTPHTRCFTLLHGTWLLSSGATTLVSAMVLRHFSQALSLKTKVMPCKKLLFSMLHSCHVYSILHVTILEFYILKLKCILKTCKSSFFNLFFLNLKLQSVIYFG